MTQSNQAAQQLEAASAFLAVVLVERAGSLTPLQHELLTSTLTRVRRAKGLLRTSLADAKTLDATTGWQARRSGSTDRYLSHPATTGHKEPDYERPDSSLSQSTHEAKS